MAPQNLLNPIKTSVFAVCITKNTPFRNQSVEAAVTAFEAQDYPGPKRLLLIGDRSLSVFKKHKKSTKLHHLHVPENAYSLGELRNLAKTYIATLCSREKRTHYIMHWDDDDFSHPDRIMNQVIVTPTGSVSMMTKTVRHSFQTGFSLVGGDGPLGDLGTLMYPANVPACFGKSFKNVSEKFVTALLETKVPVFSAALDPVMCVRTHHGDNVTGYTKFVQQNQSSRALMSAEQNYLQYALKHPFAFVPPAVC